MLKRWGSKVVAFDAEWVPCVATGRRLLGLERELDDAVVREAMWKAHPDYDAFTNPRPFLKLALSRVTTIAAASVDFAGSQPYPVRVWSAVASTSQSEAGLIAFFLNTALQGARGTTQLVGYNSRNADFPLFLQRLLQDPTQQVPALARPEKPWDRADWLDRYAHWHVDLLDVLGGSGSANPKLAELAAALSLPAKPMTGADVLEADEDATRRYCEHDALLALAVYLRMRKVSGELRGPVALHESHHLDHPEWSTWST